MLSSGDSQGARAAAREAVISPEKAAGLMSDALAHTLQRIQYAARDMQRLQQAAAPDPAAPQAAALRSAMEDLRLGKVPPERAEKHVQQALCSAAAPDSPEESIQQRDGKHAAQRFAELRKRFLEQLDAAQQHWPAASLPPDARGNAEFAHGLGRAFALIDELFLENKQVDDPAAPLPALPRPMKKEESCRSPRA